MTYTSKSLQAVGWSRRVLVGSLIAVALFILTSLLTVAQVSLGGLISEKLLDRSGTADSSLILGRSGTDTALHILGFAPVVSTVAATGLSAGEATATLQGTVTNMNGMPTATGYFQWGYNAGALVNTTATFAVAAPGNYSTTIGGFDNTQRVFYRFVTDADGTAYGDVGNFLVPSGFGGFLLKALLRIVLAAVIIVSVLKIAAKGGWIPLLIWSLVGLVGFAMVNAIIETLI